jgi:hypothetical protein
LAGKRFRWEWRRIEDLLEEAREKFKCEKAWSSCNCIILRLRFINFPRTAVDFHLIISHSILKLFFPLENFFRYQI